METSPSFVLSERLQPKLLRIGNSQSAVVVIDEFSGEVDSIIDIAAELAPYPSHPSYYPGLRRIISSSDEAADGYVVQTCELAAPFIGGAFDIEDFAVIEASFSMVTTEPSRLSSPQRAPHFDTTDQQHLALLHYLHVPEGSGTAFYRQRSTGIERVDEGNVGEFVRAGKEEAAKLPSDSGYIHGSDSFFEQIGAVEAVPDRLIIYQGSLLHSGIIPKGMSFSEDPRRGRLTANLFVHGN